MKLRRLLLTTDFSKEARGAYRAGASLARRFDSQIRLVHVAEPLHFTMGLHSLVPRAEYIKEIGERLEREAKDDVFTGVPVETKLLEGSPSHTCIEEYARGAQVDLVLIASHGHTGIEYALLGSFTQKIVQHSSVPVLTYRPLGGAQKEQEFAPRRVLVPFDFSQNARGVLPALRTLHDTYAPTFVLLYALEPAPAVMSEPLAGAFAAAVQEAADVAAREADKRFERLVSEDLSGLDVECIVSRGFAFREIVDTAKREDSDLIVMSTHGWTGLRHLLIGSVAEKVVRKAHCSVLTVHPSAEE